MDYDILKEKMVKDQLISRGIRDPRVIEALRRIPRHEFIPVEFKQHAYEDHPVTIGSGQTISQPYIVALMTEALRLKKEDVVLEIGTGCGYQTAILTDMCREVYSIERIADLSQRAKSILERLKYHNVHFKVGDGTLGWPEDISFDAVVVTAAAPEILSHLVMQLKDNGRLVIPIGDRYNQALFRIEKKDGQVSSEEICRCVFVPLIGKFGWRN